MGMAGAGKSTLAVALGRAIGAPVHHLDAHYWKPGWVASSPDELRQAVLELVVQDSWVIDGNYWKAALEERLERADAVVVMTVPRRLAMWRIVRRSLRH